MMRACQNYIPVKGIILMERSIIFGRAAGILMAASSPKNRLSDEDNRILEIAAEDIKRIIGDMKFALHGKTDADFPPISPTTDSLFDLTWYEVQSAYRFIGEKRLMEQEIVRVELWQYFIPIYKVLESARLGQICANKALVERSIEFFQHLKNHFWQEGESRVNMERMREDTD